MPLLTDFSKFRSAAESLVAEFITSDLSRKLRESGLIFDNFDNIIVGENIYAITKYDKFASITRGILHIADFNILYLSRPGREKAFMAFGNDQYDASELLNIIHRYHLTNCRTLIEMEQSGRMGRYCISQRLDGKFRYVFMKNNKKQVDREDQKLNLCSNCREIIEKEIVIPNKDDFFPKDFFEKTDSSKWIRDCAYPLDVQVEEFGYTTDWEKISNKLKEEYNFCCQQCGANMINQKKLLHVHHISAGKQDNRKCNLKCLCIKCHAEQPNHAHMKSLPEYREFLQQQG